MQVINTYKSIEDAKGGTEKRGEIDGLLQFLFSNLELKYIEEEKVIFGN